MADPVGQAVASWVDLFQRDPESRLRMACARRAGIPYGEALLRWRDIDDLAAELAWDHLEAEHAFRRCPQCGVDPADMEDERGRPLKEPGWKVVGRGCLACEMIDGLTESLSDTERRTWRYRLAPRLPGEPRVVDAGRGDDDD